MNSKDLEKKEEKKHSNHTAGVLPVPGGPVRKTRGGDLCIRSSCSRVRTRHASLRPNSATASPSVRTSIRGGTLQWTMTEVAGPTNLDGEDNLKPDVTTIFLFFY